MSRSTRTGWYRLQNGRGPLFHGPLPEGAVEVPAPGAEPAPVDIGMVGYAGRLEDQSKARLVEVARAAGLSTSGTKAALIARLTEQPVDASDGVPQVEAVALGDEQGAELEQLAGAEALIDAGDQDPDVLGHEDQG